MRNIWSYREKSQLRFAFCLRWWARRDRLLAQSEWSASTRACRVASHDHPRRVFAALVTTPTGESKNLKVEQMLMNSKKLRFVRIERSNHNICKKFLEAFLATRLSSQYRQVPFRPKHLSAFAARLLYYTFFNRTFAMTFVARVPLLREKYLHRGFFRRNCWRQVASNCHDCWYSYLKSVTVLGCPVGLKSWRHGDISHTLGSFQHLLINPQPKHCNRKPGRCIGPPMMPLRFRCDTLREKT